MESDTKIIYLSASPLPNIWANSSQTVKTCEALRKGGFNIELWTLGKAEEKTIYDYYVIRKKFPFRLFPFKSKKERPKFAGVLFNIKIFFLLVKERKKKQILLYTREVLFWPVLFVLKIFYHTPFIFEAHRAEPRNLYDRLGRSFCLRFAEALVVISKGLEVFCKNINPNVFVAFCGVDPARFKNIISKETARKLLAVEQDSVAVGYVGSLQEYEGVKYLIAAMVSLFPDFKNVELWIIGGTEVEIKSLQSAVPKRFDDRVHFVKHIPYNDVPKYLPAFDIVAIPLVKNELGASPVKMFEYLFVGRPIIASRLPAIEEVLEDGKNAVLFKPGDSRDIANAIARLLQDGKLAASIAEKAKSDAIHFTFDERACHIGDAINVALNRLSR
jgi:glycosyltransferase involved in cell wall biosynthesis